MEELIKKNKLIMLDYCLFLFAFCMSIFELENISILILIIASCIFIKIVKDMVGNYMSFPVLFSAFHVLYGLAGIISKCWFNQLSATYGNKFVYSPYLIAYSLCTIALLTGIIIARKKYNLSYENSINKEDKDIKKYFLFVAYCGFALTSLCEIINFIRVGGISTLLAGKAIYQAAVDELLFTLPSQYIFQVSLAALGIFLIISISNNEKILIRKIILCICVALPYLTSIILLGRRGPILAMILILLVALFQTKPLKKLSVKLVIILAITYLILGTLYAVRDNIGLLFSDFNKFKENLDINYILRTLNPAITEFGCTYGNFNKFYITNDYELLYGKSYLQGLTHIIPSYLYPGEKPKMITYVFRDKYFPVKAEISNVASTGFSSILETYWNFGYAGALIYVLYGYLVMFLEKKIKNRSYFCMLEYISIITAVQSFHRSEFGHIFSEIMLLTIIVLGVYLFYKIIYSKKNKIFDFTRNKVAFLKKGD